MNTLQPAFRRRGLAIAAQHLREPEPEAPIKEVAVKPGFCELCMTHIGRGIGFHRPKCNGEKK